MNIINKIRVNLFYKELKPFTHLDIDGLFKIKGFKEKYSTVVKSVIDIASSKNFNKGDADKYIMFMSKLDSVELLDKYLYTLENVSDYFYDLNLIDVFKDKNFYEIYNKFGSTTIPDNIVNLVKAGLSDRLVYFMGISQNQFVDYSRIVVLEDPYWDLFKHDFVCKGTSFLVDHSYSKDLLDLIIQNNAMEGMKYCYENIPESRSFIETSVTKKNPFMFQFDMQFINSFSPEMLNMLYKKRCFYETQEGKALHEIYKLGNIELIEDLTYYEPINLTFGYLDESDYSKNVLEANYNSNSKNSLFLSKYFGINLHQFNTYKVLVDTYSKIDNLPEELKNKYGSVLELLNYGYYASKEDLVKLSKNYNFESRETYQKLLVEIEMELNNFLRSDFASELKSRGEKNLETAEKKNFEGVDVYEFNGNAFTMLVHAVVNNPMSTNNHMVSKIVEDPSVWESIEDGNMYLSTSLISDAYMITYGIPDNNDTVMYGFNSLEPSMIKIMDTDDLGVERNTKSTSFTFREKLGMNDVNTVTTLDDFMDKTVKHNQSKGSSKIWNEVLIDRTNPKTHEKIKPDYIVCMDYISPNSVKAAKYFNVPICLINRKAYIKSEVEDLVVEEEEVKTL